MILPAMSSLGETDVTTISIVRFSFSSTNACSRYPPLVITAITKRKLITMGIMIFAASFSSTIRVPSKDTWVKWLPSVRRSKLGMVSPASKLVRMSVSTSVRISLLSGLLK